MRGRCKGRFQSPNLIGWVGKNAYAIVISLSAVLLFQSQVLAQQAGDTSFSCDPTAATYNNVTLNQLANVYAYRGRNHSQECVGQSNGDTDMVAWSLANDALATFAFGHRGGAFGRDVWFDASNDVSKIDGICVNGAAFTAGTPIKLAAGQTHTIKYNTGATSWIGTIVIAANNTLSLARGIELTAGTIPVNQCVAATTSSTSSESEQQQTAATHTQNRATNIANNQPNATGFIDGTFEQGGGSLGNFGLVANEAGFTSRFSTSLGRIWSEMDRNTARAMAGSALNGNTPAYLADGKALQNGLILAPASTEGEQSQTAAVVDPELSLSGAIKSNADENTYGSTASVENTSQLSAAQQRGYDVWMQVYGAKSEAGNSESTLWVGYAGAHKFINPNFLIGGLVQMDWADEENNTAGSSADGTGWMVGPYIAYKAPDQNLFFDARAAWGRSDNDITTAGATGSFETERWMMSAKVSGLFRENGWDIRPSVSASYFEETQESYTDSTSTVVGSQTFTQGEIRFGPTFSYDMLQDDGATIRPKFGVNGVWNFNVDNGASSQGAVLGTGDIRARLDAGVTIIGTNLWSLDLSGFYDGIGINNYEAYGGKARVTVPLQ